MPKDHDKTVLEMTLGLLERLKVIFDSIMEPDDKAEETMLLPENVAEFILSKLCACMKSEAGVLFIMGEPAVHYFYLRGRGGGEGLSVVRDVKPGSSMAAWVAKHGEALLTSEGTVDESLRAWPVGEEDFDVQDAVCVPLIRDGLVYGALGVANKEAGASLAPGDFEVLKRIVQPLSIFLSNLASCRLLYQRFREDALLNRLETWGEDTDQNDFSRCIVEAVASYFSCDTACLYGLDPEREALVLMAKAGELKTPEILVKHMDSGLAGAAFTGGIPVIVPDCLSDPRYDPDIDGSVEKPTSILVQPMVREELSVGLLFAYRPASKPFSTVDQPLMGKVARLVISTGARIRYLASLENTKESLVSDLDQSNRLQKKTTEFMSELGAAMRTPLFSMKATLELLQEGVPGALNPHQTELVKVLGRDIGNLEKSIFDLLVFTEIDRGRVKLTMVPTDLAGVIRSAAETLEKQMEIKEIKLKLGIPDGLPTLVADAERLKHVFINLLSNAVNWSPRGSSIQVTVSSDEVYATVRVADSGPGIPEEERENIFELFYQSDYTGEEIEGGRGLGLAIAKKVVDVHDGRIAVKSEPNEGSVFEVRLPLVRGGES